jgi:hypothetical protein
MGARYTLLIFWWVRTVNFLNSFVARARWTFSTFFLFCQLSPYLAVRVTVNYVDYFQRYNGELSGNSFRSLSLVLSTFWGHLSVHCLDILAGATGQNCRKLVGCHTIFVDRPDGELWILSIVNFSIFFRAIFRYMFGLLTVRFFDILCDATWSITAIFFFGASLCELYPHFSVATGEWIWLVCNVRLFNVFVVSIGQLWNRVGRLTIITSKFCGVLHIEFPWYCTLRISDKYIHICRPLTVIAVFIKSGGPERLNCHEILLGFSRQIFLIWYRMPLC